ncbi:MAG TPA: PGPGW domain-containing protein [Candidatus Limnocylindria bacterium]|nr:PGPGW domain-containing protein [Candidatus Limnocylindria bacterium]
MSNWKERIKKFTDVNPRTKKIIGVVLIIIGFLALVTPLTPGSWLIFVGLEFLGIRLAAWQKFKAWFTKQK